MVYVKMPDGRELQAEFSTKDNVWPNTAIKSDRVILMYKIGENINIEALIEI